MNFIKSASNHQKVVVGTASISSNNSRDSVSPSLFDSKKASAFVITETNKVAAKKVTQQKVAEGWRWVSKDVIHDKDGYNPDRGYFKRYRIIEKNEKPDRSDFDQSDIVLLKKTSKEIESKDDRQRFYYLNNKNVVSEGHCQANWDADKLGEYFTSHVNDFDLPSNPVLKAHQMPQFNEGDWIVAEGKTLRRIDSTTEDPVEKKILKDLKDEYKKKCDASSYANSKEDDGGLSLELSGINLNGSEKVFQPGELPPCYLERSYARLNGAYIRHLERLPKLQKAFERFFEVTKKNLPLSVSLYKSTPIAYKKCLVVELKNNPITKDDILLIHQALGIRVNATQDSTVENTIPFKKVLELLTCFDPLKFHDCPWYVKLTILGENRGFLLSQGQPAGNDNQLLVSMAASPAKKEGVYQFVGNAYPFWTGYNKMSAKVVSTILNNPISKSTQTQANGKDILEFIVCTQVVESHCTPGRLSKSRVPGSGKQARAILQHHIETNKPSLSSSFKAADQNNTRVFPMAGTGGTSNTRRAVNALLKPEGKAPCDDMSDDSSTSDYD